MNTMFQDILDEWKEDSDALEGKIKKLKEKIAGLFEEIKHGDDEHQRWLKEKIDTYFKDELDKK